MHCSVVYLLTPTRMGPSRPAIRTWNGYSRERTSWLLSPWQAMTCWAGWSRMNSKSSRESDASCTYTIWLSMNDIADSALQLPSSTIYETLPQNAGSGSSMSKPRSWPASKGLGCGEGISSARKTSGTASAVDRHRSVSMKNLVWQRRGLSTSIHHNPAYIDGCDDGHI